MFIKIFIISLVSIFLYIFLSDKLLSKKLEYIVNNTNEILKSEKGEKPLTIEELRQMEGNIVFITPLNDWAKVMDYGLVYFGTEKTSLWQDMVGDYGKKWLAYNQKPKERQNNG